MDAARRTRVLRQHLRTDQLLGVEAVPLGVAGDGAVLESQTVEPATMASTLPASAPSVSSSPSSVSRPSVAPARPPVVPRDASTSLVSPPAMPPAVPPTAPPVSRAQPLAEDKLPQVPVYPHAIELDAKVHLLHNMDVNEVRDCRRCGLCAGRTQTVFGEGDPNANLLFIGEGPGENEDLQGRPFIGRAGQKLEEMIIAMGLARKQVYIANVVKCRPPNNRAPTGPEVLACWDYLKRQIETIQPRAIVTLGGPATKQILQTDRGITTIRGIWHQFDALKPAGPSIPVMPTFHPAYLLRAYTPENRKKVWSDLQKVMKLLQV